MPIQVLLYVFVRSSARRRGKNILSLCFVRDAALYVRAVHTEHTEWSFNSSLLKQECVKIAWMFKLAWCICPLKHKKMRLKKSKVVIWGPLMKNNAWRNFICYASAILLQWIFHMIATKAPQLNKKTPLRHRRDLKCSQLGVFTRAPRIFNWLKTLWWTHGLKLLWIMVTWFLLHNLGLLWAQLMQKAQCNERKLCKKRHYHSSYLLLGVAVGHCNFVK